MDPHAVAQLIAGIVFCMVYLYVVIVNRHLAAAMWLGVAALVAVPPFFGLQPILTPLDLIRLQDGSWAAVNWNVIGIFAGTLLVAEVFIYSRAPAAMADWLINKTPNVCWSILGVCAISGFISAFAANVATVLIVAPIALELAKRLQVSPVPFLIGIAIAANLEGTATLIGDPPSMIFAAQYKMNFMDFFWYGGRPGIFFAVQIGAIASFAVLWLLFRKYEQPVTQLPREKLRSWFPTVVMVLMIVALAFGSLVDRRFAWFGGAVSMAAGATAVGWLYRRERKIALGVLKSYDWVTTFFLIGIFTMVYALTTTGLVETAAKAVYGVTGSSPLGAFVLVTFASMVLSGFIDNIPYIAAMLPLVQTLGIQIGVGDNMALPFGLLLGTCLGGNITPVGASANVVAYGMLRSMGEKVSFMGFVRIGLPFTLAATAAGALFTWIVWMWF